MSNEPIYCPICGKKLTKYGFHKRKLNLIDEEIEVLVTLPRYKCKSCHSTHVGFPEEIVPYKRYESKAIEAVIDGKEESEYLAVEEGTKESWTRWNEEVVGPKAEAALAKKEALDARKVTSSLLKEFKAKHKSYLSKIVVLIYQNERQISNIVQLSCPP